MSLAAKPQRSGATQESGGSSPSPFCIKVRNVNMRGWRPHSGGTTILLRLRLKVPRRKLGDCTQRTFTCPAPGSMSRSRTGRGRPRAGSVPTTFCRILGGWMQNYLGCGGPPYSDAISAYNEKQSKAGCYKIASDCTLSVLGMTLEGNCKNKLGLRTESLKQ